MSEENILLVDDDSEMLLSLTRALKASGVTAALHAASKHQKALELLKSTEPQAAIVDLCLDESKGIESGFNLIKDILSNDPTCRVIVLTGHGSPEYGVRAINLGAANFIEKPADSMHLAALIKDAVSQSNLRREYSKILKDSLPLKNSSIIGSSSAIDNLRRELEYAAGNTQSVLITGETGTGKGLLAKVIHSSSARTTGKFVRYQANFSTADLVNSELFGHLKGSFTGANEDRKGLFSEAGGGTFFLDEIDELPLETQVSLLGVLQEKKYRALGSDQEIELDIRLICATNQDIEKCLAEGKIRKDFYHRIAHCKIHIPALRDRKEDIPELTRHIIKKLCDAENLILPDIEKAALDKLKTYSWPGNVRELEAVIESAVYRAQFENRTFISAENIKLQMNDTPADMAKKSFHDQVRDYKLKLIKEKLAETGGNQLKAANELGLDRSTLRKFLLMLN